MPTQRIGLIRSGLWLLLPMRWFGSLQQLESRRLSLVVGDFLNVPLLGTRGGINYNPELAMRQFGFPMRAKPINLATSQEFFYYSNVPAGQRKAFIDAWSKVGRKDVKHLGVRSGIAHEAYTQWVIDRAEEIGMPYPAMRHVSASIPSRPLPLLPATQEMY